MTAHKRDGLCSWVVTPVHSAFGVWSLVSHPSKSALTWKLFLSRRKFPTDKLRNRQRQLPTTNSLDSDSTSFQTGSIDISCPPRDLFFSLSYPVSPAVARRTQTKQCLPHPESTYVISCNLRCDDLFLEHRRQPTTQRNQFTHDKSHVRDGRWKALLTTHLSGTTVLSPRLWRLLRLFPPAIDQRGQQGSCREAGI